MTATTETPEKLSIGDCCPLRRSGAQNHVYAIPGKERNDGIPHVYVWSNVGGGTPAPAYHHRWLYLGDIPQDAVTDEVERVLREHESEILDLLDGYQGTRWDGNNYVGVWATDREEFGMTIEADPSARPIYDALQAVPCRWRASEWFAHSTAHQILEYGKALDERVEWEMDAARENDAYLDADDVRAYLQHIAKKALDRDDYSDAALATARAWLGLTSEIP